MSSHLGGQYSLSLLPITHILIEDVKNIRMESIYEEGNYGIQHKMGTNIVFMNAESKKYFSFDYTLFENHTILKKLLLDKLGIRS
jgi:hypothetical protein